MLGFSLLKTRRNKTYNYTPRYWDERKERLEKIKQKHELRTDEMMIRGSRRKTFREDWKTSRTGPANRAQRLRTWVIIGILFVIAYFILDRLNLLSYL